MMRLRYLVWIFFFCASSAYAKSFDSEHILVVDDASGKVILEKNANNITPIASLTKLMTAMLVIDSHAAMDEKITVEEADVDKVKHSSSRLPVGSTLTRGEMLQIALMSSENRAASALARHYPGGYAAFMAAATAKVKALGMTQTVIVEPTGLSPENVSTAADLMKLAKAASQYKLIREVTSDEAEQLHVRRRDIEFHNTNSLVGKNGWKILLSKTGFTNEAGSCLIMQILIAKKKATMVILKAKAKSTRLRDIVNIRRLLEARVDD